MGVRLTEKKLRDARFRRTEEAIFEVFFGRGSGAKISVDELIGKIGVDRVTFYRHHRAVCEIVEDYERYILEKYVELIKEVRKRDKVGLRRAYYEMVIFILQNRRIFEMLVRGRNLRVIQEMILILRPEIVALVELLGCSERVLRVYVGGIMGLVEDWGMGGFKEMEVVKLLNDMMYLTEVIRGGFLALEN